MNLTDYYIQQLYETLEESYIAHNSEIHNICSNIIKGSIIPLLFPISLEVHYINKPPGKFSKEH